MTGIEQKQRKRGIQVKKNNISQSKQNTKTTNHSGCGFYYSFLTIVLLLCLIQITISAVLNVSKVISYKAKIIQITNTLDAAMALNEQLKDNIKNFSNVGGLEEIARNNLKMSGADEVLVIINTPNEENTKEDKAKYSWFQKHNK